jgi:predicted nucleic acid-binding protein
MSATFNGSVVFDCEALSRAINNDYYVRAIIEEAHAARVAVCVSTVTLVEATHKKSDKAALNWITSRLTIVPATEAIARLASNLLIAASLHGHRHALDAIVCATALLQPGGTPTIFTSDPADLSKLVANKADVIPLR